MSEQIKELLKKDIVKIASLSLQRDYSEKEKIGELYDELLTTHAFYTNFGNRYMARLQAILKEDTFEHKCVLCGKDSGENPVICQQCLNEIPIKEEKKQEEIQEDVTVEKVIQEETAEEENLQEIGIVQSGIEVAVENKKSDIEEIVENNSGDEKTNNSKIDSKKTYFLYAVIVILLIVIFKQSIVDEAGNGKKNEFTVTQAKKVVEEYYDKTNYKISLQEVSECPKAIFEASQGKQVPQEAWLSSELIGVYAFSIEDAKENMLGQVWVSFQGEAIQLGMTENEKFIVLKDQLME